MRGPQRGDSGPKGATRHDSPQPLAGSRPRLPLRALDVNRGGHWTRLQRQHVRDESRVRCDPCSAPTPHTLSVVCSPHARRCASKHADPMTGRAAHAPARAVQPGSAPPDRPRGHRTTETWLILPVVIRLSQRLSHACLSISIIQ